MKAVVIAQAGGPEVLALCDHPAPQHGDGECLIRVHASGVNRPDVLQRKGLYPPPPGASEIPGLEVAGVIEAGDEAALAAAGISRINHIESMIPEKLDPEFRKMAMEKIVGTGTAELPLGEGMDLGALLQPEVKLMDENGGRVALLDDLFPQDTAREEKKPEHNERAVYSEDKANAGKEEG